MSDLLVIDWDTTHVRALVGSRGGGTLRASKAAIAPIEGDPTAANIIEALRPLLADLHSGKSKVVLVMGGREVKCRLLRVPPVPKDELPEVVRLRASTEFPTLDDTATIDYLPLSAGSDDAQTVFAARVNDNTLINARNICTKLHLAPEVITMRGSGIAQLATQQLTDLAHGIHLIVAERGSELDLVGISDGQTVAVRSVPEPSEGDVETRAKAATREVRRTIAAMSSELNVKDIQSLVWIVGSDENADIADRCGRALSRRVVQIDIRSLGESSDVWPAEAAGFAGLLGSGDALASRNVPIDFLAPRKPPEKKAPITTYALAGALAAIVCLGGGWMAYSNVSKFRQKAEVAEKKQSDHEAEIKKLEPELKQASEVEQWLATDVNWLDELDRLAMTLRPQELDNHEEFDVERDVLLRSIIAKQAPGRNGVGGSLTIAGAAKSQVVVKEVEDLLRDEFHQVTPGLLDEDEQEKTYVWNFRDEIAVTPNEEDRQ